MRRQASAWFGTVDQRRRTICPAMYSREISDVWRSRYGSHTSQKLQQLPTLHLGQGGAVASAADLPQVRTPALANSGHRLSRAREPYMWRAAGFLRRQRYGPMRAADTPPATEPLSASVRRER